VFYWLFGLLFHDTQQLLSKGSKFEASGGRQQSHLALIQSQPKLAA
jgi:hypothetical protein